jgi:voltage-gated potassium channel
VLLISRRLWVNYKNTRLTKHLSGNLFKRVLKLSFIMILLVIINSVSMIFFEKMSPGDAVWLSLTTMTTVGYGDFSPSTFMGRATTTIFMYGLAISVLTMLISEIIEWRIFTALKKKQGLWEWKDMLDHIQIINTPKIDAERYLLRLIKEMKSTPQLSDLPIQLLTRKYPDGLPASLESLKVLHRTGEAEDGSILSTIGIASAKYIVILARDYSDSISDSVTFDILSRVLEINPNTTVVVEAILDENRKRFLKMGASAVLRPVRAYPQIVVRSLTNIGSERLLENLFESHGDSIHCVDCEFNGITWKDAVIKCIDNNLGTPIGYFSKGELFSQPDFNVECNGDSLAIIVKENVDVTGDMVTRALALPND